LTLKAPGIVVVTGFEANDPPCRNASAALVEALEGCLPQLRRASGDAEVRIRLMPGNTLALSAALGAALDELPPPTHLLLLGQAPGRNKITPERFATNVRDFGTPDRYGNLPRNLPVVEGGPSSLHSTWPGQDSLVRVLNASGIPAAMSHDAGNHLCNQLLYLALHAGARRDRQYVAAFVHIPVLPQQVIDEEPMTMRHPNCPCLPLSLLIEAVACLLRTTFSPDFL
jgi:pyroglutamyl-peptidase